MPPACVLQVSQFLTAEVAGEPDDVAKTHKVKEKKDGAPEKIPGFIWSFLFPGSGPTMARRFNHIEKTTRLS